MCMFEISGGTAGSCRCSKNTRPCRAARGKGAEGRAKGGRGTVDQLRNASSQHTFAGEVDGFALAVTHLDGLGI